MAMSSTRAERRAFAKSGIPLDEDLGQPYPKRLLKRPLFWLSVVMLLVYGYSRLKPTGVSRSEGS